MSDYDLSRDYRGALFWALAALEVGNLPTYASDFGRRQDQRWGDLARVLSAHFDRLNSMAAEAGSRSVEYIPKFTTETSPSDVKTELTGILLDMFKNAVAIEDYFKDLKENNPLNLAKGSLQRLVEEICERRDSGTRGFSYRVFGSFVKNGADEELLQACLEASELAEILGVTEPISRPLPVIDQLSWREEWAKLRTYCLNAIERKQSDKEEGERPPLGEFADFKEIADYRGEGHEAMRKKLERLEVKFPDISREVDAGAVRHGEARKLYRTKETMALLSKRVRPQSIRDNKK